MDDKHSDVDQIYAAGKVIGEYEGTFPVCTVGALNCPPEDVGGIWGFRSSKKR